MATPLISVIVLNYNGARWIQRCLDSLKNQTIFDQIEVIVPDNLSTDGSDLLAEKIVETWPNGLFIQHGENLGYCKGNNRAAERAKGDYILFLNNDTWLEPDCLEKLVAGTRHAGASVAGPLALNYSDNTFQSLGARGFDIFGLATKRDAFSETNDVLMPEGCAYLIERKLFYDLGCFDPEFFMFADEFEFSWRVWLSGHKAVGVPAARLHHRGAAQVNPAGGGTVVEFRTSYTKRYYANRNSLLVLLKDGQHVLLLMVPLQVALLVVEAVVGIFVVRRWGFIKRAYIDAIADCWRLRKHVLEQRRFVKTLRTKGDFWIIRFLRARPKRWDEIIHVSKLGLPKVSAD